VRAGDAISCTRRGLSVPQAARAGRPRVDARHRAGNGTHPLRLVHDRVGLPVRGAGGHMGDARLRPRDPLPLPPRPDRRRPRVAHAPPGVRGPPPPPLDRRERARVVDHRARRWLRLRGRRTRRGRALRRAHHRAQPRGVSLWRRVGQRGPRGVGAPGPRRDGRRACHQPRRAAGAVLQRARAGQPRCPPARRGLPLHLRGEVVLARRPLGKHRRLLHLPRRGHLLRPAPPALAGAHRPGRLHLLPARPARSPTPSSAASASA